MALGQRVDNGFAELDGRLENGLEECRYNVHKCSIFSPFVYITSYIIVISNCWVGKRILLYTKCEIIFSYALSRVIGTFMIFASVLVSVLCLIVDFSLYKDSDSCISFSLLETMNLTTGCP